MRRVVGYLLVLGLVMMGCNNSRRADEAQPLDLPSSRATAVTTTVESDGTSLTTSPAVPLSTTTSMTVALAPGVIFPPVRGVFAPRTGWIVSETPYVIGIAFWGAPTPEAVIVNGEDMIDEDGRRRVWFSAPIDLAPGVSELHLEVEHQGRIVEDTEIPVTYLEGAEERLGWIAAANEDSIAVDFTEWDENQEFPGPEDPDPGVLVALPVGNEVRVVVDSDVEVDYQWLEAEVNAGYANLEGLSGFDDWNPGGVYPYVLTIHNGHVVQIWKIPLG